MMNKLSKEYSDAITVIEGLDTITLSDLKSKLRGFYKRKLKDANTNEIEEKSDTDDDFEIIDLTTNNKTFFDYEYVEDTQVYTTCEETENALLA